MCAASVSLYGYSHGKTASSDPATAYHNLKTHASVSTHSITVGLVKLRTIIIEILFNIILANHKLADI